jgi:hypothetical protein
LDTWSNRPATLDRLEDEEIISSWLADPTPERGGHSKRHYRRDSGEVMNLRKLPHLAVIVGLSMSGLISPDVDAQPTPTVADTFVPAAVDGFWLGTLEAGAQSLRIQITVKSDAAGHEPCTLDSLDQGALGLSAGKPAISLGASD